MKQYKNAIGIICVIFISACILIGCSISKIYEQPFDIVVINDIARSAAKNWDDLSVLSEINIGQDYVILDTNDKVKYSSSNYTISGINEAVRKEYIHTPIVIDGNYFGNVVILSGGQTRINEAVNKIVIIGFVSLAVILIVLLLFGLYIKKDIVDPFSRLKEFASAVSEGNLDVPLEMDKANLFGAFSESFDIMREEIKMSRKRENDLKCKEKEMIASLSHDLKTPITGIKLTCELLNVKLEKDEDKNKVNNIFAKAEQIDLLVNDLFTTTLEDLGEMKVICADEEAALLEEIVRRVDVKDLVDQSVIPECLINVDKRRLEQIISNVINNSYKYANTRIEVNYSIIEGYLRMGIRDFGKGVSQDEIHLVTNKFYRGKNSSELSSDGSGLGLHISKMLIEQMNGEIRCSVENPGFLVTLLIPLS